MTPEQKKVLNMIVTAASLEAKRHLGEDFNVIVIVHSNVDEADLGVFTKQADIEKTMNALSTATMCVRENLISSMHMARVSIRH